VQAGKKTAADIVAMVSTKAILSADQVAAIHDLEVIDVPQQPEHAPAAEAPREPGADDDQDEFVRDMA